MRYSEMTKEQKHLYVRQLSILIVLIASIILSLFLPVFKLQTTSSEIVEDLANELIAFAHSSNPEEYKDVEMPTEINVSVKTALKTIFFIGVVIELSRNTLEEIENSTNQSDSTSKPDNLDSATNHESQLVKQINKGNLLDLLECVPLIAGIVSGNFLNFIVSLFALLYLVTLFIVSVIEAGVAIYLLIKTKRLASLQKEFNFFTSVDENGKTGYVFPLGSILFPLIFTILNPSFMPGIATIISCILLGAVVLFNLVYIYFGTPDRSIIIVQILSFVGVLSIIVFFVFLTISGFVLELGNLLTKNLLKGLLTSALGAEGSSDIIMISIFTIIIFCAVVLTIMRCFHKNISCLGSMVLSTRIRVMPSFIKRQAICFAIFTGLPFVVDVIFDISILNKIESPYYYVSVGCLLISVVVELIMLLYGKYIARSYDAVRMGDNYFYEERDFFYLFLRETPKKIKKEVEEIKIVHGTVPTYIPDEWYEDDNS